MNQNQNAGGLLKSWNLEQKKKETGKKFNSLGETQSVSESEHVSCCVVCVSLSLPLVFPSLASLRSAIQTIVFLFVDVSKS